VSRLTAMAIVALLSALAVGCAYYHVVRPGDTLYSLSKEYGVSVQELQKENPGLDPYNLQIGEQLKIPRLPGQQKTDYAAKPSKQKPAADQAKNATPPPDEPEPTPPPAKPKKDPPKQLADKQKTDKNAAVAPAAVGVGPAAKASSKARFIWPAPGGKVTSRFGEQADGVVAHGIEISAPEGSPVVAAADGKVVLASDQFKGYGNMIVIRHDDNFFTIYSFNKTMSVQKGDVVKSGQQIATVGKTGRAVTPMLDFQVRIGSKAVDPLQYLPQ